MKRAIYCLIYTAILFSGCQKDDTEPSDNNNQNLISQNLQSHNGEVSQFAYIIPVRRYIGSGYDITGRYCGYYSVKEPVLDISALKEDTYQIFKGPTGNMEYFVGANVEEFLKAIESKTIARNVVPYENKGDLLFTGTVAGGDNADIDQKKDPYVYSTQFSFALLNNNYINSQHRIDRSQQPFDESLFTENLKQDLQTLSADEIVEKYGTHVIVEAFIGLGIHAQFRSVNIAHNKEESVYENALYYVAKMVYDNYSATDVQKKAVTVNYGTTSTFEFKGGDHSLIPSIILKGNEIIRNWKEEEFDRWKESYDVNETLVKLPDNGLIPIYSMINDATLQTEIKEAVVRYIKSKQPECTGTIPLTISEEIGNGICHYNTDRSDCKTIGVLGSLYNKQMDDTYPLFLYSNETGERLSFEGDLECGMTKSGIIGYCYKEKINQDLDMLVEITDGKQYRYILNYGIDYGNNWKVTGSTIYTKRINQL